MPLDPHLGYKLFIRGWLYPKISVLQLKYCATQWYTERQAQARSDAALPSCTRVMINSAFQCMKHQLSISFPSSSTLITAEILPEIYYGAIKAADYLFRINEMWFNGVCVGVQANEEVLVFWDSVQMLYNQGFQMKITVNSWALSKLILALPQLHYWLNCSPLPDSPIAWDGRKMGSSSRWVVYSRWTPDTGLAKLHFQTGEALPVRAGAAFWASISRTWGAGTMGHWCICQNNVWPCLKSERCSSHPRAGHRACSRGWFCSALGIPPMNMDWDVLRDLSLNFSFPCLAKFSLCSPAVPPPRGWCNGQRWKGACTKMKPRHWGIKSHSYGKNMCLWRLPLNLAHTFCSL